MDLKTLELVNNLKKSLKEDKRIIKLNELESIMENDDEVKILSYQKEMAINKYNDALRIYGENSDEASLLLKELKEKVDALNNNEKVKEYLKAYKEVKKLYEDINKILFDDYKLSSLKKD